MRKELITDPKLPRSAQIGNHRPPIGVRRSTEAKLSISINVHISLVFHTVCRAQFDQCERRLLLVDDSVSFVTPEDEGDELHNEEEAQPLAAAKQRSDRG